MEEHRRAADDLDVAEAEPLQVRRGELAADPDRRPVIQDGRHEAPDRRLHRHEAVGIETGVGLRADAEDDDRDPEPLDELAQPDEVRLVRYAEGVRQRDDVGVVALVDAVCGTRVDDEAVHVDGRATRGEELVGGLEEDEVAAVATDHVCLEGGLGRDDLERVLPGTEEESLHRPNLIVRAGWAV